VLKDEDHEEEGKARPHHALVRYDVYLNPKAVQSRVLHGNDCFASFLQYFDFCIIGADVSCAAVEQESQYNQQILVNARRVAEVLDVLLIGVVRSADAENFRPVRLGLGLHAKRINVLLKHEKVRINQQNQRKVMQSVNEHVDNEESKQCDVVHVHLVKACKDQH